MMRLDAVILENAFVRLEPVAEMHREDLRAAGAHADIWTYMLASAQGARFDAFFDAMLDGLASGARIPFTIFDQCTNDVLGSTSYYMIDAAHATVEIGGTWYVPAARGGAVNPSCKRLVIGHAFESGANRVEFKTDARNARSRAALIKLGASLDGVHRRRHILSDGYVRDTAYYSLLTEEWPAVRANLDARIAAYSR